MFGFLKKLRQEFQERNEIPSSLDFLELDMGKIKKELGLSHYGELRGKKNLPPSSASDYDEVELKIIATIESASKKNYDNFLNNLNAYAFRAGANQINASLQEIKGISAKAKATFKAQITDATNILYTCKRELEQTYSEMENFRKNNQLIRAASSPESKLIHISTIIILFAIESFLNGNFFSKGNDLGLIGGISTACLISTCNILGGLFAGWVVFRFINHKRFFLKSYGIIFGAIYFILVAIFNFLIAHYRVALSDPMIENAGKLAMATFLKTPFSISDFDSLLLIILGMLFSFIACFDGYKMDDPYPFYGKLARTLKSREEEYSNTMQNIFKNLDDTRDSALSELKTEIRKLDFLKNDFDNLRTNMSILKTRYTNHLDYLKKCCNQLLFSYRNFNRKHRTEQPPEYFDSPWEKNFDLADIDNGIQKIETTITNVENSIFKRLEEELGEKNISSYIMNEYEKTIDEFKNLGDLHRVNHHV